MDKISVLLIGGGGREHAMAHALSRSPMLATLYNNSANPGIAEYAHAVALNEKHHADVVAFCAAHDIGLVIIGPEAPLVDGLADSLRTAGVPVFGPSQAAAQLEGSKAFTKALCDEAGIPTAAYGRFADKTAALAYVAHHGTPIVVKANGLAAGKGVTVAMDVAQANAAIEDCFAGAFGAAGAEVVIEAFLDGEEASFFALCDGENVVALTSAQDHKRAFDGDQGPNTGGMGAYSPAPCLTPALQMETMERIILPTVRTMQARGTPYVGVLYAGLMLTQTGVQLIEYNCRFGDPETQVILPRLKSDFLELALQTASGGLKNAAVQWHDTHTLCVVYAAQGYPGTVKKGTVIQDVDVANSFENCKIYHAGTVLNDAEQLVANGGRVLCSVGSGASLARAQYAAYTGIAAINWPEGFYRSDIGWRALT